MGRTVKHETLLSPFRIGNLRLKNRIVKAPQGLFLGGKEGLVTEEVKSLYESIARGGTGMIEFEGTVIDPTPSGIDFMSIWDNRFIPGFRELVKGIHKFDCPIIMELVHAGPAAAKAVTGLQPLSSSSLSQNELPSPTFSPPRGMDLSEIHALVENYVRGAERAREAGFDGVEVHSANCHLLASFLTRAWNRRNDAYGCQDLNSRARLVVEIVQRIKGSLGNDYPVGVRMNGEEWGVANGMTSEESTGIARILESAGVDYIHVAGYGYGERPWRHLPEQWLFPEPVENMKPFQKRLRNPGLFIPAAEAIKKAVSIPVVGVGYLDLDRAERALRRGMVDLVAFGRPLLADPDLPRKLADGKHKDIAPCTRCATCQTTTPAGTRRCRINPAIGNDRSHLEKMTSKASSQKRVMVVGAGPAGMEAARVAALRGHKVLLFEKETRLGGLLPLAALVKGLEIEDLPAIIRYLKAQVEVLGVEVRLGTEVTLELVREIKPDAVVLAVGGSHAALQIPGIDGPNVLTSAALHKKVRLPLRLLGPGILGRLTRLYLPIGKKVVILGGAMEGLEIAEFLVQRGRQVTVAEASGQLGKGVSQGYIERFIPWLADKGVALLTGVKVERISRREVFMTTQEGQRQTIPADSVLVAMPPEPNTGLFHALRGQITDVHLIGAGNGSDTKLIADAIAAGRRVGLSL